MQTPKTQEPQESKEAEDEEESCDCCEKDGSPKETQYRKTKASSLIGLMLCGMYKEYRNEVLFVMSNIPEFADRKTTDFWKQIKESLINRDVEVVKRFAETNPWFTCPDFDKASIESIRADTAFAVFVKSIE